MPSNYKKSDLIELLSILGVPSSTKSVKAQLEADITKHLASYPNDAQLDSRLPSFVEGASGSKAGASSANAAHSDEDDDAEEAVEEKLGEVGRKIGGSWTKVKTAGSSLTHRTKGAIDTFRGGLSTVASVNFILIVLEYATIIFLNWPRTVLGKYVLSWEEVSEKLTTESLLYTGLLVLPALVFSFIVNFTRKSAIRRKKHIYTFDPILFGLVRFFSAILYHFIRPDVEYALISGASGLTSALIGIYASILQTP